jgi:lysophospholipase L1-like esterase
MVSFRANCSETMRFVLAASGALNIVAIAAGAWIVYHRGGLDYLSNRLAGNPAFAGYSNREHHFRRLPRPSLRPIVMLGDSITADGEWGELLPGVINRGIGGDTSAGVLRRIQTVINARPRAVYLMIGTNDAYMLGLSPRQTAANVRKIVRRLRRGVPDARIYVQTLLPGAGEGKNRTVRAINAELRRGVPGAELIDMHDAFCRNGSMNPAYSADGLHLNGDGYRLWLEFLLARR